MAGWRSALAELGLYVALLLAPIAVGLALIGAIFVGTWRMLRGERIGLVLTIFVAVSLAMAFGGFMLVAALAPRG